MIQNFCYDLSRIDLRDISFGCSISLIWVEKVLANTKAYERLYWNILAL